MYNVKRMSEIIVNAKTLCVLMRLRRAGRVPQSGINPFRARSHPPEDYRKRKFIFRFR